MKIIERATGQLVQSIVRPAHDSDKVLWSHWHGEMPPGAEDAHWDWDELIDLSIAMTDRFEVYVLEHANELHGLRMLEVADDEVATHGVHSLRLSVAPWNRSPERRYHGVGSALVAVAIMRSLELGHRGCIHCESLPGAEGFHESNGMTLFNGRSAEGLRRFRFTEDTAAYFLRRLQRDGLIQ